VSNILSEETIKITTQGVMKAEAQLDSLKGKTGALHQTVRAVGLGLTQFAGNLQKIGRIAGMLSFGGAAGLGAILHGGFKGTQEANALSQAWEQFTRVISDRFAPYVRMLALALQDVTKWFGGLSEATRDSIAQWALIGTGIAGVVALVPVLVAGFSGIVGVFAAIISPAGLVIAMIGGIMIAAAKMFSLFQTGGADTADALQGYNQSWLQGLLSGIQSAMTGMAKLFNWISERIRERQNELARFFAHWGERIKIRNLRTGEFEPLLPPGTARVLKEDIAGEKPPPKIDIEGLNELFAKVRRGAGQMEANLDGIGAQINDWWESLKLRAGPGGATPAGKAAFESPQSMWERLQKGLMGQDADAEARRQTAIQRQMKEVLDSILGAIGALRPAVQ
jgi:hypothetical protein